MKTSSYAGRYENTWVTYNPNKDGSNCGAVLSLQYNTCKNLDVNFNQYGNALIQEYSDRIEIYANNFDEKIKPRCEQTPLKSMAVLQSPHILQKIPDGIKLLLKLSKIIPMELTH